MPIAGSDGINIYCMIVLYKVLKQKKLNYNARSKKSWEKRGYYYWERHERASRVQVIFLFLDQGNGYMGIFTFDDTFGFTL